MKISILGCGWLGMPLANELIKEFKVKGATTSREKIPAMASLGIEPYLISVGTDGINGNIESFLDSDVLYINIPPKRNISNNVSSYPERILSLLSHMNHSISKIIFISSTSVYNNICGTVDESAQQIPEKESGLALIKAEELVKKCGVDWVILRMAGLIGPKRDPGKWFASKSNIANGFAPINLVHLDDCIEISKLIINSDYKNDILNVCSDNHPSRKEFYTLHAKRLGLQLPSFKDELKDYKLVSNNKLKMALGYNYIHSDLLLCNIF